MHDIVNKITTDRRNFRNKRKDQQRTCDETANGLGCAQKRSADCHKRMYVRVEPRLPVRVVLDDPIQVVLEHPIAHPGRISENRDQLSYSRLVRVTLDYIRLLVVFHHPCNYVLHLGKVVVALLELVRRNAPIVLNDIKRRSKVTKSIERTGQAARLVSL